jgi:hypothetical protein
MTPEVINKRVEQLQAQAKQMEANLHMISGAVQDCQYWLNQLESKDAANQVNDPQGAES